MVVVVVVVLVHVVVVVVLMLVVIAGHTYREVAHTYTKTSKHTFTPTPLALLVGSVWWVTAATGCGATGATRASSPTNSSWVAHS